MRRADDDPDPPPSRYGLVMAGLIMLTGTIFIWSLQRGWRPW